MKDYLTIKQTVDYIKRTDNTIRRVLIRKRNKINENEKFEVIKRIGNLYYIYKPYLDKRYNIKHTENIHAIKPIKGSTEDIIELKETVKMYAIMLEEKDKQIIRLKEENNYFKSQNEKMTNSIITTLDQSQKLTALEKQLEILKIEK